MYVLALPSGNTYGCFFLKTWPTLLQGRISRLPPHCHTRNEISAQNTWDPVRFCPCCHPPLNTSCTHDTFIKTDSGPAAHITVYSQCRGPNECFNKSNEITRCSWEWDGKPAGFTTCSTITTISCGFIKFMKLWSEKREKTGSGAWFCWSFSSPLSQDDTCWVSLITLRS